MRIQLSHDFFLDEFVPQEIYRKYGAKPIWFVDKRIVDVAQFLRDHFNQPLTNNDWMDGGLRNYSGFRTPDVQIGATLSQHKYGRAIDIHVKGITPEEIRHEIRNNSHYFFQGGVRAVEMDTPTWVHIDIRETKKILWIPYY